jgi:hypothetical protein
MPLEEIRAILATDDPDLIRRYLDLHRERLEEHLAADVGMLQRIERSMTAAMLSHFRRERDERARRPDVGCKGEGGRAAGSSPGWDIGRADRGAVQGRLGRS